MRLLPFLLAAFFIIPLVEIWLLIEVGTVIGAPWTIFCVVFTAVLGGLLVRAQGFITIRRIQQQLGRGEVPAIEMFEGLFLFIAGALLLTPGFFTDAIGFLCLVPPLRRALILGMLKRHIIRPVGPARRDNNTLEGSYKRMDDQDTG